ncbi:hypothetical protein MFERI13461_00535 [Mycoplasma feriruminatoris]|nr:hypothetical protein MFERI13461_00535 [Mycoplasma feriruminatoris]
MIKILILIGPISILTLTALVVLAYTNKISTASNNSTNLEHTKDSKYSCEHLKEIWRT